MDLEYVQVLELRCHALEKLELLRIRSVLELEAAQQRDITLLQDLRKMARCRERVVPPSVLPATQARRALVDPLQVVQAYALMRPRSQRQRAKGLGHVGINFVRGVWM